MKEIKYWATPTTYDAYNCKKSINTVIKHATGIRKGRSASSNLNEQVCFPWMDRIYQILKEHPNIQKQDIQSFIKTKLHDEGFDL